MVSLGSYLPRTRKKNSKCSMHLFTNSELTAITTLKKDTNHGKTVTSLYQGNLF